jgi:hypothetical protein
MPHGKTPSPSESPSGRTLDGRSDENGGIIHAQRYLSPTEVQLAHGIATAAAGSALAVGLELLAETALASKSR